MKKLLLTLTCTLVIAKTSFSQFTYSNAFSIGNTGDDNGYAITSDASGNFYTAGNFEFWMDADPGAASVILNSNGSSDGYFAKYNAAGVLVWAFNIGGTGGDIILGIKTDVNNNVFITGSFQDTIDLDPGPGINSFISNGGSDIFIAKYNAAGSFLWANRFGGADNDAAASLVYDAVNNNVIVTGYFTSDSLDMDPNGTLFLYNNIGAFTSTDGFVASYSAATAALNWAFGIGGGQSDRGEGVAVDNAGNVFATGSFNGSNVDFDPGAASQLLNSAGSVDIYIAKYNSAGVYQWANRIGATGGEIGFCIACDISGNVYGGGYFNSDSVDFDPGAGTNYLHSMGSQDLFVVKLTNNGVYQWAICAGGTSSESAQDIAVTGAGDVFITGNFGNTVDFDPGPATFNLIGDPNFDAYLAHYTSGGNFIDAIPFTGTGYEYGVGVCVIAPNHVGVTGQFSSAVVDFDPGTGVQNLTNTGSSTTFSDVFVATYSFTPTGLDDVYNSFLAFSTFPNPANNDITIIGSGKIQELTIYDVIGKEVYSASGETSTTQINTSLFPNGIYFIRLISENKSATQKLVVQH